MNPIPPISSPTGEISAQTTSPGGLKEIASAQKILLWSLLTSLIVFIVPFALIFISVFQLWAIYNMGKTLNLPNLWVWLIGALVPLVSLIVLLSMNSKATAALQLAGLRVGLMGANMNEVEKVLQQKALQQPAIQS